MLQKEPDNTLILSGQDFKFNLLRVVLNLKSIQMYDKRAIY